MNAGDTFHTAGYDLVATAVCDLGAVLVLNNNSSHFLVAEAACHVQSNGSDIAEPRTVRLVASYAYGPEDGIVLSSAREAYDRALHCMLRHALANTEED